MLYSTLKPINDTELVLIGLHVTETHVVRVPCVSSAEVTTTFRWICECALWRPLVPTASTTQSMHMCFQIYV